MRPLGDVIGLHGDVAEVRGRCARGVVPSSLLHALGEARVGGRLVDERAPEDGHPPYGEGNGKGEGEGEGEDEGEGEGEGEGERS